MQQEFSKVFMVHLAVSGAQERETTELSSQVCRKAPFESMSKYLTAQLILLINSSSSKKKKKSDLKKLSEILRYFRS